MPIMEHLRQRQSRVDGLFHLVEEETKLTPRTGWLVILPIHIPRGK